MASKNNTVITAGIRNNARLAEVWMDEWKVESLFIVLVFLFKKREIIRNKENNSFRK